MGRTKPTTITIDICNDDIDTLAELNKAVPLATRHGLAKVAFQTGLQRISERPDTLPELLVALRRRRPANVCPDTAK